MTDDELAVLAEQLRCSMPDGVILGDYYILRGEHVVPVDWAMWGVWYEHRLDQRLLRRTVVIPTVTVSTVFLGFDQRLIGSGPPLLFESMVFGGLLDGEQARYGTYADAITGHDALVARVHRAEQGESL